MAIQTIFSRAARSQLSGPKKGSGYLKPAPLSFTNQHPGIATAIAASRIPAFPSSSPAYTPAQSSAGGVNVAAPGSTTTKVPDIRDPDYFNTVAQLQQYYGTTKAQIGAAHDTDIASLNRAKTILGYDPTNDSLKSSNYDKSGALNMGTYYQDTQAAKTAANKAGLFYSGQLGQNLGNINQSYADKLGSLNTEYSGRENLRNLQLGDLEANYGANGLKYQEALNAAGNRQADRDAQAASMGGLAALTSAIQGTPATPVGAGPVQYSGAKGLQGNKYIDASGGIHATTKKGNKTYYLSSSGKWVPI